MDFSTMFSLPKLETLRVIIPGIFGYRMEEFSTPPDPFVTSLGGMGGWPERFVQGLTDKSSAYWGRVGEEPILTALPDLESSNPKVRAAAIANFTSRAEIIEVMRGDNLGIRAQIVRSVKLISRDTSATIPATANTPASWWRCSPFLPCSIPSAATASPYTLLERRLVWFWGAGRAVLPGGGLGTVLLSLRAAFPSARRLLYSQSDQVHAPVRHRLGHPGRIWSGSVLSLLPAEPAQAIHGPAVAPTQPRLRKLTLFDKGCLVGLLLIVIGIFVGFQKYAGSKLALANYIANHGFGEPTQPVIDAIGVENRRLFH